MRKRWLPRVLGASAVIAISLTVFLLWPSPIDPLAWTPPSRPALEGVLAPNEALDQARLVAVSRGHGPEGLAIDAQGDIWGGLQDGELVRFTADGQMHEVTNTGGRPLGMQFDAAGDLIICDAYKGLLKWTRAGKLEVLATAADGVPFRFTDDLDIASDGRIYFTDASSRFWQRDYLFDLLEARPYGRLLRYDPRTKSTEVLLDDLYFANGVALSQDESFVLINETYRYRIRRYGLTGEKAGKSDVFMDNVPGFPDNITRAPDGGFWVALFTTRKPIVDDTLHPSPWLKKQIAKLPKPLWPKPARYGFVLKLDASGKLERTLQDPDCSTACIITSALEHEGKLYLGSLHEPQIAILDL
jgi:sugar lactone lactonase YvrE